MEIDPTGLLPYQVEPARQLLRALERFGGALDGSDMGVGKTFITGAVLRARDVPTLVVGPMISETGWKKMGNALGVEFDYCHYELLRTGQTPFGQWEHPRPKQLRQKLVCSSCQCVVELSNQKCPYHHLGIHCVETKKIPHRHGKFIWHPGIKQLAFDEVHRCNAIDSLQSDMLIAAKRQGIPSLALSATSAESPLQLRALGFLLGLHSLVDRQPGCPGFWRWAFANGCRKLPFGGFHFAVGEERKKEILAEIHGHIFPERGCRVRIAELGDQFPECQITAELYDLEAAGRLERCYDEMESALARLEESRADDVETPLTEILRARQQIELLLVPIFVELAQDAVAEGKHVALFVNFRATVDELCARLKTNCRIDGSQTGVAGAEKRIENMRVFQEDREPFIVGTEAMTASIDLHDVRGEFPRLGLVSLGYSARVFRQLCGRLRRAGAKSKSLYRIILAAGTRQEKVHKAVSAKLNNLDALNDADLWAENLPLSKFRVSEKLQQQIERE